MKKILVVVSVVLVALVIFGTGFFFAQSNLVSAAGLPAAFGFGGMMNGRGGIMGGPGGQGQVHEYIEQALADKLGMTKADLEAEEAAGKSLYQIAIDKGTAEADVTALLTEVHKTAFDKAVADGALTQVQADAMLQAMTANGFKYNSRGGMMGAYGGMMGGRGGQGQVHEYLEQALADKLGMTRADLEAEEAAGKSLYQIALDKGIAEADLTALFTEIHKTALDKAVADGVLTQVQADAMLQNMTANGFNYQNCPMQNGGAGGRSGRSGRGQGGMMGGWNQPGTVQQ